MHWALSILALLLLRGGAPAPPAHAPRVLCPSCVPGDSRRAFDERDVRLNLATFVSALAEVEPLSRNDFALLLGQECPFEEELERAVCRGRQLRASKYLNEPAEEACEEWITARARLNSPSLFFLLFEALVPTSRLTPSSSAWDLVLTDGFWRIFHVNELGRKDVELKHPRTLGETDLYLLHPMSVGEEPISEIVSVWLRGLESGELLLRVPVDLPPGAPKERL